MHAPEFQKLEGTWRGFKHLVFSSETSATLRIKVFNVSKQDLYKDLDKAVEFDQSQIFKKLYENEFGHPGGEPYGALVGDYEFTSHPQDVDMLTKMSQVAAAAFCPFISAASPGLFGFKDYTELSKPRDLEKIFDTVEYTQWKSFRESEDSRFVTLVMPRVLSRLPYGKSTVPVEEFDFEEVDLDAKGKAKKVPHANYSWMNASYVLGAKLTEAFAKNGWCTAIRGVENGGKVEGLPAHIFTSDDGDADLQCPSEIGITDRREAELSKLGFLPLCHFKNTDYSVFFGAQTAQKLGVLRRPDRAETKGVRPQGDERDGQRGDLREAALHHGHLPDRALPEGDRARQDRLLHGGQRLPGLADPLDLRLHLRRREGERGDEGEVSAGGGQDRGPGGPREARLLPGGGLAPPLAPARRADHLAPDGGPNPAEGLRAGCPGPMKGEFTTETLRHGEDAVMPGAGSGSFHVGPPCLRASVVLLLRSWP